MTPAALVVVAVALVLDVANRYEPIGIDFHTYLAAAVVGLQHGWALIYDQGAVSAVQKHLVADQVAQPFLSPPTDAWLTAPLTPLPYWVAYWIWTAINLVAFAASLVWASRSTGDHYPEMSSATKKYKKEARPGAGVPGRASCLCSPKISGGRRRGPAQSRRSGSSR